MDRKMLFLVLMVILPITKGGVPGTFYWQPRLGIDLALPGATERMLRMPLPEDKMRQGSVVIISGYQAGVSVVALAACATNKDLNTQISPFSAKLYTDAYRWLLRHISLMPSWLRGDGSYSDTQKLWRQRFIFADDLVPVPLRYLFPYIQTKDWDQEESELKRYKKYSESAFTKFYRFPSRQFNNFASMETAETLEVQNSESV